MATQSSKLLIDIKALDNVTPSLKNIQSGIIRFVGAVTASLVAVRGIAFPIQEAAKFEKELKNVQKTTGFTTGQIDGLGQSLNRLSTNLLTSQEELAQIAATAGQLGLGQYGVEAITSFTESVARASATFDIGAESLAGMSAQILNIFDGVDVSRIENVFSAINEVSNNSVASAANLIDIIKRVGSVANLTFTQVNALAAQSQDLGVSSEVAGTTLVKQFSRMQSEAEKFADVMNITTDEWVSKVDDDALNAFKEVQLAISKLGTAGQAEAIKELFGGGRIFALAAKQVRDAANGFVLLDKSLNNANEEFVRGRSSIEEYAVIASSLSGRSSQLGNTFRALANDAGTTLLPAMKELVSVLDEFLKTEEARAAFDSLAKTLQNTIGAVKDFIANAKEYSAVWLNLIPAIKTFLAIGLARALVRIGSVFVITTRDIVKMTSAVNSLQTAWLNVTKYFSGTKIGESIAEASRAASARRALTESAAPKETLAEQAKIQLQKEAVANNAIIQKQLEKRIATTKLELSANVANNNIEKSFIASETKRLAVQNKVLDNRLKAGTISIAEAAAQKKRLDAEAAQLAAVVEQNVVRQSTLRTATVQLGVLQRQADVQKNIVAGAAAEGVARKTNLLGGIGGLGQEWARGSAGAKRYTGAVNGASKATKGLLPFVGKLGAGLAAIATGPVGGFLLTLGLGFALFGEQIKDFLGIVEDADKAVAESKAGKATRNIIRQAKTDAEVYRKELARELDNEAAGIPVLPVDIDTRLISDDADVQKEAVELVEARVKVLSDRIKGLRGEALLAQVEFSNWAPALQQGQQQLDALNAKIQQQKDLIELIQQSSANNPNAARSQQKGLIKLEQQRADLQKQVLLIQTQQENIGNRAAQYAEDETEANKELLVTLQKTGRVRNAEQFNALRLLVERNRASQVEAALRAEIADIEAKRLKLQEKGLTGDSATDSRTAAQLQAYSAQIKELSGVEKQATKVTDTFNEALREQRDTLEGGSGVVFDKFIDSLDAVSAESALAAATAKGLTAGWRSQYEELAKSSPVIQSAVDQIVELNTAIQEFSDSQILVESINASIKGVADNVKSTVAATLLGIQELKSTSKDIEASNRADIELELKISTDPVLRRIDEAASERLTDLEEKRNAALRRGEKIYAGILADRIAQVETEAKINTEAREAELAYKATRKQLEAVRASQSGIAEGAAKAINDQQRAIKALAELRSQEDSDPEAIQKAQEDVIKASVTVESFVRQLGNGAKKTQELATELEELGNVQEIEFGQVKSIVDQDEIQKDLDFATEVATDISLLFSKTVNAAQLGTSAAEKSTAAALKTLKEEREEVYQIIASELGGRAKKQISDLLNELGTLQQAGADTAEVLGKINEIIINPEVIADKVGNGDEGAGVKLTVEVDVDEENIGRKRAEIVRYMNENGIPLENFEIAGETSANLQQQIIDYNKSNPIPLNVELNTATTGNRSGRGIGGNYLGGYIRGPGTGTSDSILSRLSDGEYVIKAAAVSRYGVGLFDKLNAMAYNSLPKFATGGAVGAAASQIASGPSTDVNVNLSINGRRATLRGSRENADMFVEGLKALESSAI